MTKITKERNKAIPASYLVLRDANKILLLRRFNTGYCDGQYSLPAGHVEAKESPLDCLIREAEEEVGIQIKKQDVLSVHTMYRPLSDETNQRIDIFFEVSRWFGEIQNKEPHKCDEMSWFSINKLPKNTIPYIKAGLEALSAKKPYSDCVLGDTSTS